MKVKIKLLNEEAVLNGKSKRKENRTAQSSMTSAETEKDDEIALVSALKITGKRKPKKASKEASDLSATTAEEESNDTALFSKGKGKGGKKGKANPKGNYQWNSQTNWDNTWNDYNSQQHFSASSSYGQWNPSLKGKGYGKGKGKVDHAQGLDPQIHWCDIHQKYGHSIEWCFENPNRSGGPAPRSGAEGLWCETCNRPGHTSSTCYASTVRVPRDKGKGKRQGAASNYGNRQWKKPKFSGKLQF
jgi:hypothetical protein